MALHILPPESTTVQISSSDLVWLLSYACLIKEGEEEEEEEIKIKSDDEQCGKLHRLI